LRDDTKNGCVADYVPSGLFPKICILKRKGTEVVSGRFRISAYAFFSSYYKLVAALYEVWNKLGLVKAL